MLPLIYFGDACAYVCLLLGVPRCRVCCLRYSAFLTCRQSRPGSTDISRVRCTSVLEPISLQFYF